MATEKKEEVVGAGSQDTPVSTTTRPVRERDLHSLQVKPEFVLESRAESLPPLMETDDRKQNSDSTGRDQQKLSGKKNRGRNKKRPRDVNITADNKICLALLRGEECSYGAEQCRFSHDLKEYLASRPPDIKIKGFLESCPNFERLGFCHFGCMCRFADCHINAATGANLGELKEKEDPVMNILSPDLRTQLRRNTYPFVCQRHKHANRKNNGKKDDSAEEVGNGGPVDGKAPSTSNGSDFSPLPTKTRKIVDFSNKVYVAPLSA